MQELLFPSSGKLKLMNNNSFFVYLCTNSESLRVTFDCFILVSLVCFYNHDEGVSLLFQPDVSLQRILMSGGFRYLSQWKRKVGCAHSSDPLRFTMANFMAGNVCEEEKFFAIQFTCLKHTSILLDTMKRSRLGLGLAWGPKQAGKYGDAFFNRSQKFRWKFSKQNYCFIGHKVVFWLLVFMLYLVMLDVVIFFSVCKGSIIWKDQQMVIEHHAQQW